ncbi:YqaA family protein [Magnetovibrio sp. PR-2]|uniref:YqaA family protein n=1 Tax=Magnetovibrio sp. PR-2 TaxID=3120356 RepID=UPI002FCDFFB3
MLRRTYDWTMKLAEHEHALWALFLVAFIESSVFPIPPDILLIPMVLACREKAWKIAAVCTLGSVLGGMLGYGIGFFLFEQLGGPILDMYGKLEKFEEFQQMYNEWGAWVVAMAGLTPFPYKVITIASGVTALNIVTFVIASVISRGIRFFLEAWLLWYFGDPIREFIDKYLGILVTIGFVVLLGGFVAVKYVM